MYKILMASASLCALLWLSGCIASQRAGNNAPEVKNNAPVINLPPPQSVDTKGVTEEIKREILASSNTTQNQLTGLLNASVSKLADKLNGVEANIKELVKIEANMNNTANAEIRAKVDTALTATAVMNAEMKNIVEVSSKMEAAFTTQVKALSDIHVKLGSIDTNMANAANAQVGANNRFDQKMQTLHETITASAGRDVNMLPRSAVDLLQYNLWAFVTIFSILAGVATIVVGRAYKNAREREVLRTQAERDERKRVTNLLYKVLAMLPEKDAADVSREISRSIDGVQSAV
jgi:hypothetical protein